jgi:hypothetical protein
VVSEKPGILLANSAGYEYTRAPTTQVALAGRVLVKVNLEGGEIKIGDRITLSSTPGVGAKATTSGMTIGIALEPYYGGSTSIDSVYDKDAIGKILVFVNLSQYRLALEDEPIIKNHEKRIGNLEEQIANLQFSIFNFQSISNASIFNASSSATSTGDSVISQGFSWVLEQFKNIGIIIAEGFIQVKNLVADIITSREIATEYLRVSEQLVIGSKEKPIGMTIFERGTGNPICVYAEGGILKTTAGECGAEALVGTDSFSGTVSALELPENTTSTPDVETTSMEPMEPTSYVGETATSAPDVVEPTSYVGDVGETAASPEPISELAPASEPADPAPDFPFVP